VKEPESRIAEERRAGNGGEVRYESGGEVEL